MAKQSIEWHEVVIHHHSNYVYSLMVRAEAARKEYERSAADLAHHKMQVAEAKKRGLKEFDANKLLKKRSAT